MKVEGSMVGVGSRCWGQDWDSSGKEVYPKLLLQFLREDLQEIMQEEQVFLGYFFEIAGLFLVIEQSKLSVRYVKKTRSITCSIEICYKDVLLNEHEFCLLFASWVKESVPLIVKKLKDNGILINFVRFESSMMLLCDKIVLIGYG